MCSQLNGQPVHDFEIRAVTQNKESQLAICHLAYFKVSPTPYLSNTLTNLCIVLYCIVFYCIVSFSIVLYC